VVPVQLLGGRVRLFMVWMRVELSVDSECRDGH
jgi:hypothetical protein